MPRAIALPYRVAARRASALAALAVGVPLSQRSLRYGGLLLSLALSAPAWLPFLLPQMSLWRLYDGEAHLLRTYYLQELIAAGDWYPRWMPQQYGGYGYPTLTFYAPGLYYATWLLALLTPLGLYGALQAVGAAGAAGVVAGTYALGRRVWRHEPAAVLAAGSVAYAPYLLPANLYTSGGLPAVLGPALAVWLVLACHGLWENLAAGPDGTREGEPARHSWRGSPGWNDLRGWRGWRWWWGTVALTVALMLIHNVSALLGGAMAALWLLCLALWRPGLRRWADVRTASSWALRPAAAAVLGALLTAFFWLPALLEASRVQVERLNRGNLHYRNHFLIWPGFHSGIWGEQWRGPWTIGAPIDLHLIYPHSLYGPPRLGLWQGVTALAALAALLVWTLSRRRPRSPSHAHLSHSPHSSHRRGALAAVSVAYGLAISLLAYAQSFDWALPLWERYAALRALQLPSRLLGPAVIGLGIAAGGALALTLREGRRAWAVALLAVLTLTATGLPGRSLPLDPEASHRVDVQTAIGRERVQPGSTASTNEFLPRTADYVEWHEGEARGFWLYDRMFPEASWTGGRVLVWDGAAAIHAVSGELLWTTVDVTVEGSDDAALAFHQLAFPGWRAWVDGLPTAVSAAPLIEAQAFSPGFLVVQVPPGRHQVSVRFGPAGPRVWAAELSLATLLGLAAAGTLAARRGGRRFAAVGLSLGALLVCGVFGVRTLLPIRPPAGAPENAIVALNLADEVLAGRAALSSPTGAALGPGKFLDVRHLTITAQDRPLRDAGPQPRRWLYTHPPATVAVELTVPPDAYFQTALAIDPDAWEAPLGDGVRFTLTATPLDQPSPTGATAFTDSAAVSAPTAPTTAADAETILDATLNPRARGEQRRWVSQMVDMRRWSGRRLRLTLSTSGREEGSFDWAGWGEPAVVQLDPLTASRLLDSSRRIADLTRLDQHTG